MIKNFKAIMSRIQTSENWFKRAGTSIPGGVNSPVRAFKSVGGTPVFFKSAKGAMLEDLDGNQYIDYINSWGPMILGHTHPVVQEAIVRQSTTGFSYGAPTTLEVEMAELIISMVPGLEMIRMVNSGTEACMSAIRLARGYTSRNKIIKFAGNYHGHADSFLIKAGSGALTLGMPNSPGVTPGTASDTLTARYNDLESVAQLLKENPEQVAAIIVEPVAGNMGCIPPGAGFLEGLRALCDAHGTLLIFDEVMTGFRLTPGGAQQLFKVQADLVTYGKIIGGGMPVGAFGGKRKIFEHLAPSGPVYQAGTLSGNPLAMACGIATLSMLKSQPEIYSRIDKSTEALEDGFRQMLQEKGIPHQINRCLSMISIHFCETPVKDFESAQLSDGPEFKAFFHGMLKRGVYLPPSAYESWFISQAIGEAEINLTLEAGREIIQAF
jgi:glutamate-1-semialdehyde 2,1-aminomutase